jgi:hypothetical protein
MNYSKLIYDEMKSKLVNYEMESEIKNRGACGDNLLAQDDNLSGL